MALIIQYVIHVRYAHLKTYINFQRYHEALFCNSDTFKELLLYIILLLAKW